MTVKFALLEQKWLGSNIIKLRVAGMKDTYYENSFSYWRI